MKIPKDEDIRTLWMLSERVSKALLEDDLKGASFGAILLIQELDKKLKKQEPGCTTCQGSGYRSGCTSCGWRETPDSCPVEQTHKVCRIGGVVSEEGRFYCPECWGSDRTLPPSDMIEVQQSFDCVCSKGETSRP